MPALNKERLGQAQRDSRMRKAGPKGPAEMKCVLNLSKVWAFRR